MNTETRDRAFDRIIAVPFKDNDKFLSIINDISRKDVIKNHRKADGYFYYIAKLKKQELLVIKLCVGTKSIERVKKVKKKYTYTSTGIW